MSVLVKCSISIKELSDVPGNDDTPILEVYRFVDSSAPFSLLPKKLLESFINQSSSEAVAEAHKRLTVLKGKK